MLSYQTSARLAKEFIAGLVKPCVTDGVVLLDAWHLPGLIQDPPKPREGSYKLANGDELRRTSVPSMDWSNSSTDVLYEMMLTSSQEESVFRGLVVNSLA